MPCVSCYRTWLCAGITTDCTDRTVDTGRLAAGVELQHAQASHQTHALRRMLQWPRGDKAPKYNTSSDLPVQGSGCAGLWDLQGYMQGCVPSPPFHPLGFSQQDSLVVWGVCWERLYAWMCWDVLKRYIRWGREWYCTCLQSGGGEPGWSAGLCAPQALIKGLLSAIL